MIVPFDFQFGATDVGTDKKAIDGKEDAGKMTEVMKDQQVETRGFYLHDIRLTDACSGVCFLDLDLCS